MCIRDSLYWDRYTNPYRMAYLAGMRPMIFLDQEDFNRPGYVREMMFQDEEDLWGNGDIPFQFRTPFQTVKTMWIYNNTFFDSCEASSVIADYTALNIDPLDQGEHVVLDALLDHRELFTEDQWDKIQMIDGHRLSGPNA